MNFTEISKSISDLFYISFLSYNLDDFEFLQKKYFSMDQFSLTQFVNDAVKSTSLDEKNVVLRLFKQFLPNELLEVDEKKISAIEDRIEEYKKKSDKGSCIRAVLDVLFDSRFQEELNKVSDNVYKDLFEAERNSSIVNEYLQNYSFLDERKDNYKWNYKNFTDRKQIGSTRSERIEKINNPYSGYKVYGQGEYSKLLIGLSNFDNTKDTLKNIREKGFTTIIKNESIFKYSPENSTTEITVIPYEDVIKFSLADNESKPGYNKYKKNCLILDLQLDAINRILQDFDGSYIPLNLNTSITKQRICKDDLGNPKKDTVTGKIVYEEYQSNLKTEIFNTCKAIYYKYKSSSNIDFLEKYSEMTKFSDSEIQFINRYFDKIIEFIPEDEKEEFDSRTHYQFSSRMASTEEKIIAIWSLIGSPILEDYPIKNEINNLVSNKNWKKINNLFSGENASSMNKELDDDELEYGEMIAGNYNSKKLSKEAKRLFWYFKDAFEGKNYFLDTIYSYIKGIDESEEMFIGYGSRKSQLISSLKEISNLKTVEIENYLGSRNKILWSEIESDLLSDNLEKTNKLKMIFALWCADKERSYDAIWRWYKNRELKPSNNEEVVMKAFREEMKSIYKRYLSE